MQPPAVEPVHFRDDFEASSLIEAIERSLDAPARGSYPDSLKALMARLRGSGTGPAFSEFLRDTFTVQRLPECHLTGYYQPTLAGSLEKTPLYRYPIYTLPPGELPDREAIDCNAALVGQGLEIAWVSDAVDLFFLHIQGSGRLELPGGDTREILFCGHNARPYAAIGTEVAKRGSIPIEQISMQRIKSYLREHPDQIQQILNLNPRYVFFKLADRGPIGTSGALLTPLRSIATDWQFCPPGALCHIEAPLPEFDLQGRYTGSITRSFFALNQDTGGAITGRGRTDLFTGAGDAAGRLAGALNSRGILSVFAGKTG